MIKKAIEYIVGLSAPNIHHIGGQDYSDKPLHRVSYVPRASSIEMNTLTSLIDYIMSGVDSFGEKMIVHVQTPERVSLYSALDPDRVREYVVEVKADVPSFRFGQFMDQENFCIGVQSKFLPGDDKALLLKFAGTVEAGTVTEYGDDGVSQKATVKTGIASKGDALVPNPVNLAPFRTFPEVDQPASDFIFRMKNDKYGGVQCALFEADGGAWQNRAKARIKEYLVEALKDHPNFVIIS